MAKTLYSKPIQHGEMILKPVAKTPDTNTRTVDEFIGAFSRAGHHHVLRSKGMVVSEADSKKFVDVSNEGIIVHLKASDQHKNLLLPVGKYQINIKTEYDIYEDVISEVQD